MNLSKSPRSIRKRLPIMQACNSFNLYPGLYPKSRKKLQNECGLGRLRHHKTLKIHARILWKRLSIALADHCARILRG